MDLVLTGVDKVNSQTSPRSKRVGLSRLSTIWEKADSGASLSK